MTGGAATASVTDFAVKAPGGGSVPLAEHRGKVLLIVNVASKCGYTPQYAGLEALRRDHGPRGFEVLGFPCNQFLGQEPGSDAEIAAFCATSYDVTFPIYAKIDVNGAGADPLYAHLKKAAPGLMGLTPIKWNFTKFLVDRNGRVVRRYAPATSPQQIERDIEVLL